MVKKSNQVAFRLPPDYVDLFANEASKQGISIHEYGKKMAIQGFISQQNGGEHTSLLVKNTVFSVMILHELVAKLLPIESSDDAIKTATHNALNALKSAGIEVDNG